MTTIANDPAVAPPDLVPVRPFSDLSTADVPYAGGKREPRTADSSGPAGPAWIRVLGAPAYAAFRAQSGLADRFRADTGERPPGRGRDRSPGRSPSGCATPGRTGSTGAARTRRRSCRPRTTAAPAWSGTSRCRTAFMQSADESFMDLASVPDDLPPRIVCESASMVVSNEVETPQHAGTRAAYMARVRNRRLCSSCRMRRATLLALQRARCIVTNGSVRRASCELGSPPTLGPRLVAQLKRLVPVDQHRPDRRSPISGE